MSKIGKWFDIFIQFLIILSLFSFSVETLPNLSNNFYYWLKIIETTTIIIFVIEYLIRFAIAEKPFSFMFSFYGLVDAIAIFPSIFLGIDLRSLRIIRLLRLFRIFKLLRYTEAINRLKSAFSLIKEEIIVYLYATGIMLYIASVGIYFFEKDTQPDKFGSVFHCLWWAVVTLTTVGYGDSYPITIGGRIFTAVILILGIGVVAVPTGLLASALASTKKQGN